MSSFNFSTVSYLCIILFGSDQQHNNYYCKELIILRTYVLRKVLLQDITHTYICAYLFDYFISFSFNSYFRLFSIHHIKTGLCDEPFLYVWRTTALKILRYRRKQSSTECVMFTQICLKLSKRVSFRAAGAATCTSSRSEFMSSSSEFDPHTSELRSDGTFTLNRSELRSECTVRS